MSHCWRNRKRRRRRNGIVRSDLRGERKNNSVRDNVALDDPNAIIIYRSVKNIALGIMIIVIVLLKLDLIRRQ